MGPHSDPEVMPEERFGDSMERVARFDTNLADMRREILNLPLSMGEELTQWLPMMLELMKKQCTYTPKSDGPFFGRSDIVHVDFGYNLGSELNGYHFGIVIEWTRGAGVSVVVPMTSEKPSAKTKPFQVDLGELLENGKRSLAWVGHIRSVSKLRMQPLAQRFRSRKVPPEKMDLVDAEIRLLTHKGEIANRFLAEVEGVGGTPKPISGISGAKEGPARNQAAMSAQPVRADPPATRGLGLPIPRKGPSDPKR